MTCYRYLYSQGDKAKTPERLSAQQIAFIRRIQLRILGLTQRMH
jgi:hypothetical protein